MKEEVNLVGFLCNWCSYAGADLAGVSRFQCPPNIRIIRVMCSGRVNEALIFRAFAAGADGIFVAGCHPGDCHYIKGNLSTRRRVIGIKALLEAIGIKPERLSLEWIGASEGKKFVETVKSFTQTIKELGPSRFDGRQGTPAG